MTAFESLRYTLVEVAGPNNEFVWTRVYDSGGGVYCAHAMAAVARHDSMSLFGIDNLLSGYGTGVGPKTLCITSPTARRQLETPRHWEPTHRRPTCSRPAFTDASAARIGALSDSRATRTEQAHRCGRRGQTAVLAGIAIHHDIHFRDVVLSQQQVGGAAVVEVQEWIVVVLPVVGEHVRRGGQAKDLEVAIAALGVHHRARGELRHERQIVTRIRQVGELFGDNGRGNIAVFRLDGRGVFGDFNRLRLRRHGQAEIDRGELTD